jgi:hypothetical protein
MKQQLNEVQKLQKIAGVIKEEDNNTINVLLQWIDKVDVNKYRSAYDFKEAVKQKILSLRIK